MNYQFNQVRIIKLDKFIKRKPIDLHLFENQEILKEQFEQNDNIDNEEIKIGLDIKDKSLNNIFNPLNSITDDFYYMNDICKFIMDNPIYDKDFHQIDIDNEGPIKTFDNDLFMKQEQLQIPQMIRRKNINSFEKVSRHLNIVRLLWEQEDSSFHMNSNNMRFGNFINQSINHNRKNWVQYLFNKEFDKRMKEYPYEIKQEQANRKIGFRDQLKSKSIQTESKKYSGKQNKVNRLLRYFESFKPYHDNDQQNLENNNRPYYRWILIGPKRSGTSMHQDPMSTSAWNTLVHGHKLWFLASPEQSIEIFGKEFIEKNSVGDIPVVEWFAYVLPNVISKLDPKKYQFFIQNPGETIQLPYKWWHAVLNLDDTIAYTQNLVTDLNVKQCLIDTQEENPKYQNKLKVNAEQKQQQSKTCIENSIYNSLLNNSQITIFNNDLFKKINFYEKMEYVEKYLVNKNQSQITSLQNSVKNGQNKKNVMEKVFGSKRTSNNNSIVKTGRNDEYLSEDDESNDEEFEYDIGNSQIII